jgi:hypothetical protein
MLVEFWQRRASFNELLARLRSKYKDDVKQAVRCIELAQDSVLVQSLWSFRSYYHRVSQRKAVSNGSYGIANISPLHLMMEADPASETLYLK